MKSKLNKIIKPILILFLCSIIFFAFSLSICEEETPVNAPPKQIIVIDPGHGGKDAGAIGPGGVLEKDLVLAVGLKLKEKLEQAGLSVILTRDSDVFIPLAERAMIANRAHADVFVSIHANAARRSALGFETYFLSAKPSDEEARKLALVENEVVTYEKPDGSDLPPDVNSDLDAILFDMAQSEYLRESEKLALTIQKELDAMLDAHNRGVKQAPFRVLVNAAAPAALVEIGFVSSRKEVKLLLAPETQDKIAEALKISVCNFAKGRAARLGAGQNEPATTTEGN